MTSILPSQPSSSPQNLMQGVELLPGVEQSISFLDFSGSQLELSFSGLGPYLRLEANGLGNNGQSTFSLKFYAGYQEILLPIPLSITLGREFFENIYRQEFPALAADQFLLEIDDFGDVHITNLEDNGLSAGLLLRDLQKPSGVQPIQVSHQSSHQINRVSRGQDDVLQGKTTNGGEYFGSTSRFLGHGKYDISNEDSIGAHEDMLVVADGLGGYENGHHASHKAVEAVLHSVGTLQEATIEARTALSFLNHILGSTPGRNICDTLFVAAKFRDSEVDLVHFGDTKWVIIRNGRIYKRSKDRSTVQKLFDDGFIDEAELYTSSCRNEVTTTVFVNFDPAFTTETLEEGDVVFLASDGADILTDEDIVEAVSKYTPQEAISLLQKKIARIQSESYTKSFNGRHGKVLRKLSDGTVISMIPSYDNVSMMAWKKPKKQQPVTAGSSNTLTTLSGFVKKFLQ